MQGFTMEMMAVVGVISYIIFLTLLLGAGVIFFRTKTLASAMFFFGLLASIILGPLGYLILIKLGIKVPFTLFNQVGVFTNIIQAIGLLLFALSLPKK